MRLTLAVFSKAFSPTFLQKPEVAGIPKFPEMARHSKVGGSGGFTFIEAIVVAAIIAILAAVAVPSYLNYVTNQRREAAEAIAQTAATAANGMWRKGQTVSNETVTAALFLPEPNFTVEVIDGCIKVTESSNSPSVDASVAYLPDSDCSDED